MQQKQRHHAAGIERVGGVESMSRSNTSFESPGETSPGLDVSWSGIDE